MFLSSTLCHYCLFSCSWYMACTMLVSVHGCYMIVTESQQMACRCDDPKTRVVPKLVRATGGDPTLPCEYSVRWAAASLHPGIHALLAALHLSMILAGNLHLLLRLCSTTRMWPWTHARRSTRWRVNSRLRTVISIFPLSSARRDRHILTNFSNGCLCWRRM